MKPTRKITVAVLLLFALTIGANGVFAEEIQEFEVKDATMVKLVYRPESMNPKILAMDLEFIKIHVLADGFDQELTFIPEKVQPEDSIVHMWEVPLYEKFTLKEGENVFLARGVSYDGVDGPEMTSKIIFSISPPPTPEPSPTPEPTATPKPAIPPALVLERVEIITETSFNK